MTGAACQPKTHRERQREEEGYGGKANKLLQRGAASRAWMPLWLEWKGYSNGIKGNVSGGVGGRRVVRLGCLREEGGALIIIGAHLRPCRTLTAFPPLT